MTSMTDFAEMENFTNLAFRKLNLFFTLYERNSTEIAVLRCHYGNCYLGQMAATLLSDPVFPITEHVAQSKPVHLLYC